MPLSMAERVKNKLRHIRRGLVTAAPEYRELASRNEVLATRAAEAESAQTQCREELDVCQQERRWLAAELASLLRYKVDELAGSAEKAAEFVNSMVMDIFRHHHRSVFWGDRLLTLDKAAGFWEDAGFSRAYQQIKNSHPYDQYNGPDGIAWRLVTLVWAARQALRCQGDFVECGVFKGDMSWVVTQTVDFANIDRAFYLYDSFEGFSPNYSSPEDFPLNPRFYDVAQEVYSIPNLYETVMARFSGLANIRVIKGFLPDTLLSQAPKEIAYLHIDLNSPQAEIGVLEYLFDRVNPGGVIVFDDYGWLEYYKQRQAEDKFMADRGYKILELPTGQGLVCK